MSDKIAIFLIKTPEEIPPKSSKPGHISHGVSDWYFGKVMTVGGEYENMIVAYYFDLKEWRVLQSGMSTLIEYYVEINE